MTTGVGRNGRVRRPPTAWWACGYATEHPLASETGSARESVRGRGSRDSASSSAKKRPKTISPSSRSQQRRKRAKSLAPYGAHEDTARCVLLLFLFCPRSIRFYAISTIMTCSPHRAHGFSLFCPPFPPFPPLTPLPRASSFLRPHFPATPRTRHLQACFRTGGIEHAQGGPPPGPPHDSPDCPPRPRGPDAASPVFGSARQKTSVLVGGGRGRAERWAGRELGGSREGVRSGHGGANGHGRMAWEGAWS